MNTEPGKWQKQSGSSVFKKKEKDFYQKLQVRYQFS